MSTPWGFLTSIVALVVSFGIYFVGAAAILAAVGPGFDKRHHLMVLIAAYQALVFGVLVVAVGILLLRRVPPSVLGFQFPGWGPLGVAAASLIPILVAADAIE